jgi:hypothetical protein
MALIGAEVPDLALDLVNSRELLQRELGSPVAQEAPGVFARMEFDSTLTLALSLATWPMTF